MKSREFEGFRVLLAEDEDISREVVRRIVEDLGAECETARDGTELLERLSGGGRFHLVLTDINMPVKGGIEACAEFRASGLPGATTLPFIGITADTNRALFDQALSAGMNSMTLKPVTHDVLLAHLTLTLKDNLANAVFCERVQQAIAAAKAKSYFFSTVSHDIRTPLNAIIGFSQMLKAGFDSAEEREQALESILVSGKTLLTLVNDILDLSKLEAGRMAIVPEPTDVGRLVREIADSFRAAQGRGSSDVEIRSAISPMPALMIDPQRIRQIVFNLAGNAVKFTKKGFVEIRASWRPGGGGAAGKLSIEVEDTGCGIAPDDQRRIASPYVQVGAGATRNGGTGLGLAICKQLASAMDGTFSLSSEPGKGSVFSVTVPGVAAAPENASPALSATQRIAPCVAPRERDGRAPRLLVVDDSKVNLKVVKAMLARLGAPDATLAEDGAAALEILRAEGPGRFDAILTDIWMPGMDGSELAEAVRADPSFRDIPVYAVTADVELQKKHSGRIFSDILLKPVTMEGLRDLLAGIGAA